MLGKEYEKRNPAGMAYRIKGENFACSDRTPTEFRNGIFIHWKGTLEGKTTRGCSMYKAGKNEKCKDEKKVVEFTLATISCFPRGLFVFSVLTCSMCSKEEAQKKCTDSPAHRFWQIELKDSVFCLFFSSRNRETSRVNKFGYKEEVF